MAIEPEAPPSPTRGRSKSRDRKSLGPEQLRPLPESLEVDIKNILAMTDVKTHIGYARAFVRLSLEKKLLSRHLRALLADTALLRSLYKRSAFLRCEEEKEQFLYHLLTLNAVDYFCFTNTYPTTSKLSNYYFFINFFTPLSEYILLFLKFGIEKGWQSSPTLRIA